MARLDGRSVPYSSEILPITPPAQVRGGVIGLCVCVFVCVCMCVCVCVCVCVCQI